MSAEEEVVSTRRTYTDAPIQARSFHVDCSISLVKKQICSTFLKTKVVTLFVTFGIFWYFIMYSLTKKLIKRVLFRIKHVEV